MPVLNPGPGGGDLDVCMSLSAGDPGKTIPRKNVSLGKIISLGKKDFSQENSPGKKVFFWGKRLFPGEKRFSWEKPFLRKDFSKKDLRRHRRRPGKKLFSQE